jgi:hypothetical protein
MSEIDLSSYRLLMEKATTKRKTKKERKKKK